MYLDVRFSSERRRGQCTFMCVCCIMAAGGVSLRARSLGLCDELCGRYECPLWNRPRWSRRILPARRIKLRLHAVLYFTTLILSCATVKTII